MPPNSRASARMLKPSLFELVIMSYSAPTPKMPVQRPDGIRIRSPITNSATAPAPKCGRPGGGGAVLGSCIGGLPQAAVDPFAIEQVVGIEGNDLALRRHEMDAGALHGADAEIVAVEKLY